MKLFYQTSVAKWTEALLLGNGRLGAMVFGGIETSGCKTLKVKVGGSIKCYTSHRCNGICFKKKSTSTPLPRLTFSWGPQVAEKHRYYYSKAVEILQAAKALNIWGGTDVQQPWQLRHPSGGTRMGENPLESVTDRQGSRNPQFVRSRQFFISDDVRLQSDGDDRGAGLLAGRLYQTSGSSWRSDLTSVTCNQPDTGLGDIEADIGTGDTSISLRAEKDRIYTITYTATDNADNKTVKTATEREEGFGAFLIY